MSDQNNFSEFNQIIFPQQSEVGELSIYEVYQFYDLPLCFSSKNKIGHVFFSTLYDCEDLLNPLWFLLPMSETRFLEIRSGYTDLYTAFVEAELDYLFLVNPSHFEKREINSFEKTVFPQQGITLDIKTHTKRTQIDDIKTFSNQTNRETIDISFENDGYTKTIFPLTLLSQNLKAIQEIVNTLPSNETKVLGKRGKIAQIQLAETELGFVENYAASFGVRMASLFPIPVLFGDSSIDSCLNTFVDVLTFSTAQTEIKEKLHNLNTRTINKYLNFLKILAFSKTSIKVSLACPKKEIRQTKLNHQEAEKLILVLTEIIEENPNEYMLDGSLIGLVVPKKTFVISYEVDGKPTIISGKILIPHLNENSYVINNHRYKFKIRELESYIAVTDEVKTEYSLLEIVEPD